MTLTLDELMGSSSSEDSPPRQPRRRHSVATGSAKNLRNDAPQYYESLQKIWASTDAKKILADARPESPSDLDRPKDSEEQANANLETLAKQTLDDLFSEEASSDAMMVAKRRHTIATPQSSRAELKGLVKNRDPLAAHPFLDGYDLHRNKQPKTSPPSSPRGGRSRAASATARDAGGLGAASWLQALAKRKVTSSKSKAPPGWTPDVNTAITVLKLRKLHAARAEGVDEDAAEAAVLDEKSELEAVDELQKLADPTADPSFDVQNFVEECWIAQALTDPARNDQILRGAYDDPSAFGQQYEPQYEQPQYEQQWQPVPSPYAHTYHQQPQQRPQPMPQPMPQPLPTYASPPTFAFAPQPQQQQMLAAPFGSFTLMPQPVPQHPQHMQMQPQPMQQHMQQQMWQPASPPAPSPMAMSPMSPPQWNAWAPPPQQQQQQASGFRRGNLVTMAQEQEGSRLLQQQLGNMSPPELATALDELAPHLASLATNAFGNYLVSSMAALPLAHGAVHAALTGNVCRLMAHPQGSRVVQAAVQKLPSHLVAHLVAELEGRVCEVAVGTHGSWSVVAAYKACRAPFIPHELAADICRLSTQQNGSRVVQRVLGEAASGADVMGMVNALLLSGQRSVRALAEDRFGNYVVQLAIKHAHGHQQSQLVEALLPAFGVLAVSKCASNVAEVVVQHASGRQLATLREALGQRDADVLRSHMYGAYVMNALEARFAGAAA